MSWLLSPSSATKITPKLISSASRNKDPPAGGTGREERGPPARLPETGVRAEGLAHPAEAPGRLAGRERQHVDQPPEHRRVSVRRE
jgi:hypothetical protein